MTNPNNPKTTNISDQLVMIDHAYHTWLRCEDGSANSTELNSYIGELLMNFARCYPPAMLLPEEYTHFMNISRELCLANGMSEDEYDSNDTENA
jgi:hypothetical protein